MSDGVATDSAPDTPDGYPHEWTVDVVLRDGSTISLRPILPGDGDGLQAMVANMSVDSVYQRFFRVKRTLEPDELHYFTHLDYVNRMAFVAIDDGELIGVGRYERKEPETDEAEVAFAVIDAHQGRGIGTQLLQHLARYARRTGISAFRAFVLADNHAMIRVFRDAGFRMRRDLDEGGVYTVEFPTEVSSESRAAEEERERVAVAASMLPVFYPHSVAVVGASRNAQSIGGRLFKNLVTGDFTGPVFPVNPSAGTVRSVKSYASVLDISGQVDLAFIVVPAHAVVEAVRECAEKGVKGLVVISAGFCETGKAGKALEEELLGVVRSAGMRMVGPNCMGVLNTDPAVSLDGHFGPVRPPRGNVAMSSQAGHSASPSSTTRTSSTSGSRRSSRWATRPTSAATTCSSTGRTTQPPT